MADPEKLFHRDAVLQGASADPTSRTVSLTLSTEFPVDRGGFVEILGHSPGEVDLTRAPLPLIESHDSARLPIGIVDNLQLVGKKLRGVARFGNSARAQEVFADVASGIIRNVSVGYSLLNDGVPEGKRTLRFRWQPIELSAVAIGADPHAGFNRNRKENLMDESYQTRSARRAAERDRERIQFAAIPAEDRAGFRSHLEFLSDAGEDPNEDLNREYSNYREQAIRTFAEIFPFEAGRDEVRALETLALGDEHMTAEAFRKRMLQMITRYSLPPSNTGQLEADRLLPGHQQDGGVSFGAGAREIQHHGNLQSFKGPNAERRAFACGQFFKSLVGDTRAAKWCAENGVVANRTMTEGIFSAGGALVPEIVSNEIINNVEQYGVFRRFARSWPMTSATLAVPVSAQGLSVSAVGENDATPTSDLALQQVHLTPKEFAGGCRASKSLLEDSAVALGDFLVTEFARALGKKEDECGFLSDGTSTYGGMTGVVYKIENQAAFAGCKVNAVSTHDVFGEIDTVDLTSLMGAVPEYARAGAAWYASATAKDLVFSRIAMAAGGNTVETMRQGAGESFAGYPVRTSQVLPAGAATAYNNKVMLLFGNLSLASAFGDRRTLDVVIDMSRFVEYRQVFFQVCERYDIVNHLSGSSATVCGPMAGLIGKT